MLQRRVLATNVAIDVLETRKHRQQYTSRSLNFERSRAACTALINRRDWVHWDQRNGRRRRVLCSHWCREPWRSFVTPRETNGASGYVFFIIRLYMRAIISSLFRICIPGRNDRAWRVTNCTQMIFSRVQRKIKNNVKNERFISSLFLSLSSRSFDRVIRGGKTARN